MRNPDEAPRYVSATSLARRGLPLLALLLVCITAASVVYALRERNHVRELAVSRDAMTAALTQTRSQVDQLSAKMNLLEAERQQRVAAAAPALDSPRPRRSAVVRVPARKRAAADPRLKKIQDQLAEHQKQIASTQEEMKKSREEIEGKLDSTRDELNGSIARNHDELVELQKRGERNYYEFELSKSKQFQRTGPISLSLRKADTKHKRFDLMLLVDDLQLEKKRVNVYEPVLIYLPDRPQPFELVINQVTKNQVKGYLSEPKYKKSELAASASAPAKPQEPAALRQR
jgi:hypothetical protein